MQGRRGSRQVLAGLAALLAAVGLVACGSGASGTASSDGSVRVMADAADATLAATSARIETTMTMEGGEQTFSEMTSSGVTDFRSGDSQLVTDFSFGAKAMHIEARVVDGARYTRLPEGMLSGAESDPVAPEPTGKWIKIPDLGRAMPSTPAIQALSGGFGGAGFDPRGVLEALRDVGDISEVGAETVRGVDTTKYHVAIDAKKLIDQLPAEVRDAKSGSHADASFDADVWIGDDGLVRRIRFSPGADIHRLVMRTELFDYGVEVHVDAPPPDEVTDFSDLGQQLIGRAQAQ